MNKYLSIINSLIDNDLYKFTQQQAVIESFQTNTVKYNFINRGVTRFPEGFDIELRRQIRMMESLKLTSIEREFIKLKCNYFKPTYIDFLNGYQYDSSEVGVTQENGELKVTISGYWYRTILWEVPLMALISELYFKMTGEEIYSRGEREKNNLEKGNTFHLHGMKVADFSTRRRYSFENQLEVVSDLKSVFDNGQPFLVGTSNVKIAQLLDLTPIGTHAHEWVSAIASLKGYAHANKEMMDHWIKTYNGHLGIALPDTFGLKSFLKDFDIFYAKLFDGVRHDSGDPFEFGDKIIEHYIGLGIDPTTKTIVFSDGLNTELAVKLHKYFKGKIKVSFGIGTNLGNDVGVKAINMVIKLIQIDQEHSIKLSEVPGKHTGDKETIELVKKMINY